MPESDVSEERASAVLERVSRWYGPVIALNDVSLGFRSGVTGLLGPNGAGKSTLIKLLTGQLRPSQGSVSVFGERVFGNPRAFARIGVSPEHEELIDYLSGRRHLVYLLRLGGFGRREAAGIASRVLERVGLATVADRRVATYSKGMRQRLRIAQATMHEPDLVVLDEPLTGLDPVGRREMIEYVRDLATQGRAIVLSGHVLHEVEKMTRRVVLIHHGRVLAEGTLAEIRACLDQRPHRIRIGTPAPREVARRMLEEPGVIRLSLEERALSLEVVQAGATFDRLMQLTEDAEVPIEDFETTDDNLQSIFDYLVA